LCEPVDLQLPAIRISTWTSRIEEDSGNERTSKKRRLVLECNRYDAKREATRSDMLIKAHHKVRQTYHSDTVPARSIEHRASSRESSQQTTESSRCQDGQLDVKNSHRDKKGFWGWSCDTKTG
jgi:hypothetical protein